MLRVLPCFILILTYVILINAYSIPGNEYLKAKVENINYNDIKFKIETVKKNDNLTETVISSVVVPGNNLFIGNRTKGDQWLYSDNTKIENDGPTPTTVNGIIEIYLDAPVLITHIQVIDQITDGTGGIPSYHSGGINYNWVKINVQGLYTKGFHFLIHIFGKPDLTRIVSSKRIKSK